MLISYQTLFINLFYFKTTRNPFISKLKIKFIQNQFLSIAQIYLGTYIYKFYGFKKLSFLLELWFIFRLRPLIFYHVMLSWCFFSVYLSIFWIIVERKFIELCVEKSLYKYCTIFRAIKSSFIAEITDLHGWHGIKTW